MTDLQQEIATAQPLEADALTMTEKADDAAQIAARLATRLVVVRAEYRAGLRDLEDREMRALTVQLGAAEKLTSSLRHAAAALYELACDPPSALVLSGEVPA